MLQHIDWCQQEPATAHHYHMDGIKDMVGEASGNYRCFVIPTSVDYRVNWPHDRWIIDFIGRVVCV